MSRYALVFTTPRRTARLAEFLAAEAIKSTQVGYVLPGLLPDSSLTARSLGRQFTYVTVRFEATDPAGARETARQAIQVLSQAAITVDVWNVVTA